MDSVFTDAIGPAVQVMSLLGILSVLVLLLGAIGIYGVVSHFVTRRKRDRRIRIALGRMMVRQHVAECPPARLEPVMRAIGWPASTFFRGVICRRDVQSACVKSGQVRRVTSVDLSRY